jgi:hypothetical protein
MCGLVFLTSIRFSASYTMKRQTLLLGALGAFLLLVMLVLVSKSSGLTLDGKIARDRARDVARFTPENSVDVAMAMGLVTHGPPKMLNPPQPGPITLLYPPSAETLDRMCGA